VAGISARPSHHHRFGLIKLTEAIDVTSYCVPHSRHGAHLTNPQALAEVLAQQFAKLMHA